MTVSWALHEEKKLTAKAYRHSNISEDGKLLGVDSQAVRIAISTELWHTDATYAKPSAMASMLLAHVVPPSGGNTEFCDSRVAYEALSPELRQRVRDMVAYHSVFEAFARMSTGLGNPEPQEYATHPPFADRWSDFTNRASGIPFVCHLISARSKG
jgi:alpha-ketoglutarate-dependent 2,4-dichlorophenoxyacetate dioxygenase